MADNISIINDNREAVASAMKAQIAAAMAKIGATAEADVVRYMTEKDIVDTGRLRGSITHQVSQGGKSVVVGTNVEYAQYVELGTSRQKARPYLRNTITKNQSKYVDILKSELS